MTLQPHPASISLPTGAAGRAPDALAVRANELKAAAISGRAQPLLRGRNVGLLCDDPAQPEALLIYRAAIKLGAHVSLVRPSFDSGDREAIAHTAHMLGKLYDSIACVALPPVLVEQLRCAAGIPVFDDASIGPSTEAAPTASVDSVTNDDRLFLWQAILTGTPA